jgi:hypothetical protein
VMRATPVRSGALAKSTPMKRRTPAKCSVTARLVLSQTESICPLTATIYLALGVLR